MIAGVIGKREHREDLGIELGKQDGRFKGYFRRNHEGRSPRPLPSKSTVICRGHSVIDEQRLVE